MGCTVEGHNPGHVDGDLSLGLRDGANRLQFREMTIKKGHRFQLFYLAYELIP
jgi:hypothetical protein